MAPRSPAASPRSLRGRRRDAPPVCERHSLRARLRPVRLRHVGTAVLATRPTGFVASGPAYNVSRSRGLFCARRPPGLRTVPVRHRSGVWIMYVGVFRGLRARLHSGPRQSSRTASCPRARRSCPRLGPQAPSEHYSQSVTAGLAPRGVWNSLRRQRGPDIRHCSEGSRLLSRATTSP